MGLLLMYALYSALLALLLVLTLPYWLLQMMRHGKYRAGLRQRFGAVSAVLTARGEKTAIWVRARWGGRVVFPPFLLPRGEKPAIWVHAVSVGEVVAASAVVVALRQKFPSHRVLVSTTDRKSTRLNSSHLG